MRKAARHPGRRSAPSGGRQGSLLPMRSYLPTLEQRGTHDALPRAAGCCLLLASAAAAAATACRRAMGGSLDWRAGGKRGRRAAACLGGGAGGGRSWRQLCCLPNAPGAALLLCSSHRTVAQVPPMDTPTEAVWNATIVEGRCHWTLQVGVAGARQRQSTILPLPNLSLPADRTDL